MRNRFSCDTHSENFWSLLWSACSSDSECSHSILRKAFHTSKRIRKPARTATSCNRNSIRGASRAITRSQFVSIVTCPTRLSASTSPRLKMAIFIPKDSPCRIFRSRFGSESETERFWKKIVSGVMKTWSMTWRKVFRAFTVTSVWVMGKRQV
jgi:hypothetical protein